MLTVFAVCYMPSVNTDEGGEVSITRQYTVYHFNCIVLQLGTSLKQRSLMLQETFGLGRVLIADFNIFAMLSE